MSAISEVHKQVYFTRYSPNDKMKTSFYGLRNTECRDIHFWCDNLLLRLFTVHFYAFYLNRHKSALVFSSNSTFFYDMLFFLRRDLKKIELLHNFTYGKKGMEFFGLANHKYLTRRVVVDGATKQNIAAQYEEYAVAEHYNERVILIEPGVYVPDKFQKNISLPLQVLYAGRGGPQKRIFLLSEIAEAMIRQQKNIRFHFAGTMMDELSDYVKTHSEIHGEISSVEEMYALYRQSHVILMTSAYEGFPMLIKEGMASGCVPVVTSLPGNKMHLVHNENALLIDHPENERKVVADAIKLLERLINDIPELERLSGNCYRYATEHFSREGFITCYRELLL